VEPFLGLPLRRFDLSSSEELVELFGRYPQPLSGYTVGMIAAWDPVFHYRWARPEPDALIISCLIDGDPNLHLLQPVGRLSGGLQRSLGEAARKLSYLVKIYGVSAAYIAENGELASHFDVAEESIASNYVYSAQDLAQLSGRKFSAKRNLIAQASRDYQWTVSAMSGADADEAIALARDLFQESSRSPSMARDVLACEVALKHFDALRLRGTGIRVQGKLAAFALWERLDAKTAVVHFERAMRTLKGLYQVVNQETARVMAAEGYELINREEDLGDPGLQKAKLSYNPVRIEKAFTLTARR
jgi:hypothetical protein